MHPWNHCNSVTYPPWLAPMIWRGWAQVQIQTRCHNFSSSFNSSVPSFFPQKNTKGVMVMTLNNHTNTFCFKLAFAPFLLYMINSLLMNRTAKYVFTNLCTLSQQTSRIDYKKNTHLLYHYNDYITIK